MAYDPKQHVIHSGNGRLEGPSPTATTSRADVRQIVAAALAAPDPELVIHFHGGLVSRDTGYEIAQRLWPRYTSDSRYGLFFVWEAGLVESIRNNLADIGNDRLFRQLVKKTARWVLGQLPANTTLKGAGSPMAADELERQFDDYFEQRRVQLPEALQATGAVAPSLKGANEPKDELTLALDIEASLQADFQFQTELEHIHNAIDPADVQAPSPKSSGVGATVTNQSEIAPEKVGEVFDVTPHTKGIFSIAKAALFLARVVRAVVRRYRKGRDHGIYTTIVEEILAAAYVDKLGGIVWEQMKKDTGDSFTDPATCAGAAVLEEIQTQMAASGRTFRRIVLVGHSTGALYIANWIDASAHFLPGLKFDVLLLAPALSYARLADTLAKNGSQIGRIRRFGMQDEVESKDVLVPVIYPRSLLYFVSGLLEHSAADSPVRVPDTPLVGMERFSTHPDTFDQDRFPEIGLVEDFISNSAGSVWSVTAGDVQPGLGSTSEKHGDFDNDDVTLDSLQHLTGSKF